MVKLLTVYHDRCPVVAEKFQQIILADYFFAAPSIHRLRYFVLLHVHFPYFLHSLFSADKQCIVLCNIWLECVMRTNFTDICSTYIDICTVSTYLDRHGM